MCEVGAAGLFEQSFPSFILRNIGKVCFGIYEAALSRRGSECHRHLPEGGQERERRGQVHDHAANRNQHPATQFQQTFTECPDLSSRTVGVCGVQA